MNERKRLIVRGNGRLHTAMLQKAKTDEGYYLTDVYGKFSESKVQAYKEVFEMYFKDIHGYDFHICSHNAAFFSVAWKTWIKDIGDAYRIISPTYDYIVVEEEENEVLSD